MQGKLCAKFYQTLCIAPALACHPLHPERLPGMNPISLTAAKALLALYVEAKDNNRPALIAEAFAQDASLTFSIDTDTISFPAKTEGAPAIAATLVSDFAKTFDHCRTYYIGDTAAALTGNTMTIPWLVVMRETAAHTLRAGKGFYSWGFAAGDDGSYRIASLHIHIERMDSVPDPGAAVLSALQSSLPYPWLPEPALKTVIEGSAAAQPGLAFLRAFAEPARMP
ncbi:nuclear transport factor 2 family protein [Cupriavidus necator]|uniref:nuclear transport factor 2 family protein n=1 Tax=Cupriavidus necator TaxID=106590 RepID=UPI002E75DEC3|nr:nuclear transport factor 2 family protein [Cupriavidus necator]